MGTGRDGRCQPLFSGVIGHTGSARGNRLGTKTKMVHLFFSPPVVVSFSFLGVCMVQNGKTGSWLGWMSSKHLFTAEGRSCVPHPYYYFNINAV
ncbi:hypothetical protein FJTKL_07675 [Diaporthe vaccinii]|uniref:Uncharacterized protein n=1 Tax=Diaporthe vaccinii TaxID=105482 RepID=A0ABR4ET96_9PEZI